MSSMRNKGIFITVEASTYNTANKGIIAQIINVINITFTKVFINTFSFYFILLIFTNTLSAKVFVDKTND